MKPIIATLALALLAGCTPGFSVTTISASTSAVSYKFCKSQLTCSDEYAATVEKAEAHCQQYGKHAQALGQPIVVDMDHAIAHFACVVA